MQKIVSVLSFRKVDKEIIDDADMGGPVLIAIIFGFLLLLVSLRVNFQRGKIYFGFIYGFGLTGCIGVFSLL